MSKTAITILISAVIIIAAVFLITKKPATDTNSDMSPVGQTQTNENQTGADYQPNGKKMAFGVFAAQGGSFQCTVTQHVGGSDTAGKVWLDGKKIHGIFSTVVQNQAITSNFTVIDDYTYAWTSMSKNGFKIKNAPVTADGNTSSGAAASGSYSWDASQIGDYECTPWTSTDSIFALPAGITFSEIKS